MNTWPRRTRRLEIVLLPWLALATLAACEEDPGHTSSEENAQPAPRPSCADGAGEVFDESGEALCVIPQPIIEVGFDCPTAYSGLRMYGQLALCGRQRAPQPTGFDLSDALVIELGRVYPKYVPRAQGACGATLCAGYALCLSSGACEPVTTANYRAFMCEQGECAFDAGEVRFACEAGCASDCSDSGAWVCGSDGARYCEACVPECYGAQVGSGCGEPPTSGVEKCVSDCAATCGEQEEAWYCGSNAQYYCSSCELHCLGLGVAPPENCAGALPPRGFTTDGM